MKTRAIPAAAMLACAAVPMGALAQSTAPLQLSPSGSWTVDFAADSCALRRSFGDGTTTVVLEMNQVAPGSSLEVAVASATLDTRNRVPRTRFLPGDKPNEAMFYRPFSTQDGLEGFAVYDSLRPQEERPGDADDASPWPDADRNEREKAITGYAVERTFDRDFVLLTGPLHQPMEVMRTCLDDLVAQWGLDPATQRTLSRQVEVDFDASWARRMIQLQPALIRNRNLGSVRARLVVDETGRVTACRMLNMPADTDDAQEFCGQMEERARLTPALDSAGQPVKSFYIWEVTMVRRTQVTQIR